jgi:hypothetical protein
VTPRARNVNGRLLHFKVNPARIEMKCIVCDKVVMKCRSRLRPGQVMVSCSPACRDLAMMLVPLGDRRRSCPQDKRST